MKRAERNYLRLTLELAPQVIAVEENFGVEDRAEAAVIIVAYKAGKNLLDVLGSLMWGVDAWLLVKVFLKRRELTAKRFAAAVDEPKRILRLLKHCSFLTPQEKRRMFIEWDEGLVWFINNNKKVLLRSNFDFIALLMRLNSPIYGLSSKKP